MAVTSAAWFISLTNVFAWEFQAKVIIMHFQIHSNLTNTLERQTQVPRNNN